jgi:hypothetical protein
MSNTQTCVGDDFERQGSHGIPSFHVLQQILIRFVSQSLFYLPSLSPLSLSFLLLISLLLLLSSSLHLLSLPYYPLPPASFSVPLFLPATVFLYSGIGLLPPPHLRALFVNSCATPPPSALTAESLSRNSIEEKCRSIYSRNPSQRLSTCEQIMHDSPDHDFFKKNSVSIPCDLHVRRARSGTPLFPRL